MYLRKLLVLMASGIALLLQSPLVQAEVLPSKGIFEGVYHRDRWGVGHFAFFLVEPNLHEKLAPVQGKRIQLEVTRAEQPHNPGPATIQEIGKITALPESPLDLEIATRPAIPSPGHSFQLLVFLHNTGKEPLSVCSSNILITYRQAVKVDRTNELAVRDDTVQMGQALIKSSKRSYLDLSRGGKIQVEPGDKFPLVVFFEEGLPLGNFEIRTECFGVRTMKDEKSLPSKQKWFPLDLKKGQEQKALSAPTFKILKTSVVQEEEDYRFTALIAPEKTGPKKIVQRGTVLHATWAGQVKAATKKCEYLSLEVGQFGEKESDGPWQLIEIPKIGLEIQGLFRRSSRFDPKAFHSVFLDLLTEQGVETITLAGSFADKPLTELPPFGPKTSGVKLRVRSAKNLFIKGEPLRFHLQAVNTTDNSVCWWGPNGGLGENIEVEIDEKPIMLPAHKAEYIEGWAAKSEWSIELPVDLSLAKGRHTLRYAINSTKGFYIDADNKTIPLLDGKLISNTVNFDVE